MRSQIEILESIAVTTQGQSAAAWRDIQQARAVTNFPVDAMRGLLSNYAASRAAEMDALKAWQDAIAA